MPVSSGRGWEKVDSNFSLEGRSSFFLLDRVACFFPELAVLVARSIHRRHDPIGSFASMDWNAFFLWTVAEILVVANRF